MWYRDKSYLSCYTKAIELSKNWEEISMMTGEELENALQEWEASEDRHEESEEFIQAWYASQPKEESTFNIKDTNTNDFDTACRQYELNNLSNNPAADCLVEVLDKVLYELKWSSGNKDLIKKVKHNMLNTDKIFNRDHIALLTLMESL